MRLTLVGVGLVVASFTLMATAGTGVTTVTSVPRFSAVRAEPTPAPTNRAVVAPITAPVPTDRALVGPIPGSAPTVIRADQVGRFIVAAAGLNAQLLTMPVPDNGILVPPDFGSAFLVEGYGEPGSRDQTVFVTMHASPRASDHAIGSLLQDEAGQPTLAVGAEIIVNGQHYRVAGSRVVVKGSLVDQVDMWDHSHDLVIVTCSEVLSQKRSRALDNALIFATLDTGD